MLHRWTPKLACLALACLCLLPQHILAAPNESNKEPATLATLTKEGKRPKVALVLAGGGAKGTAHVGVLKVLKEHRIPIDVVTGTSIGSVVGGLYALGYDVDTIEDRMLNTDFNRGYSDAIPREKHRYRRKQQLDQFNIPLELGFGKEGIKLPNGALQGQTMNQVLRELTGLVPEQASFDNLATPYRAIATDLNTRETFVFDHGNIVKAMRASSSVPGALAPVEYQGRLLIDGGISNNIPIEEAQAFKPDIIIAVDISGQLRKQNDIKGALSVIGQLTAFLTTEGTAKQIEKLANHDILITPDVSDMAMTDFGIMPDALIAGETAARQSLSLLQKLSVSEEEYQAYQEQRAQKLDATIIDNSTDIFSIIVDNQSDVHINYIEHYMQIKPGEALTRETVNSAVDRIYSIDEFQKVDIDVLGDKDDDTLVISTESKSWGPNFLEFGLGWEEDVSDDSVFNLDFAYTMKNLTSYGAEWRTQLEIGFEQAFKTEFYAPITPARHLYSRSAYHYETEEWDIYYNNNQLLNLDKYANIIDQGFGWNFDQSGFLEIGGTAEQGKISNPTFVDDIKYKSAGGYFLLGFDNLDSISFPTQGRRLTLEFYRRKENVSDDNNPSFFESEEYYSNVYELNWKGALHIGTHSFVSKLSFGEVDSPNDDSVYTIRLGGFLNLSGYHKDALVGAKKGFGAVIYQWNLGRSVLNLKQLPLYLGISAEMGNAWNGDAVQHFSDAILAGSIFIGSDTALGPALVAYGATDDGNHAVYFYLGKSF